MLQTSAVRVCACVCVVAHDRWQSFELHSTTGWARPDKGREMPRWFFFLLSHVRLSSPSRCFSAHSVQLHFVTGGMVLTSEMPHGLFFFVSVFLASPHRVACTHCSSITPASEEGERGTQAGRWERPRRDRVVPRCHDGVDGSECTARWVFRVLRATVWGTYCTMHAHAAQYLPRTVSHHSTPGQLLFIIHPRCRGPAFQPKWAGGQRQ